MQTLLEQKSELDTRNDELRKVLEAIANRRAGLTPTTVLAEAKSPKSTLHKYFTWDDTEAARRWREAQAYELIRRVQVTIITPEQKEITVRAFWPVKQVEKDGTIDAGKRGSYMPIAQVLVNDQAIAQIIAAAKSELAAFTTKYSKLEYIAEFQPLFKEIRKI